VKNCETERFFQAGKKRPPSVDCEDRQVGSISYTFIHLSRRDSTFRRFTIDLACGTVFSLSNWQGHFFGEVKEMRKMFVRKLHANPQIGVAERR